MAAGRLKRRSETTDGCSHDGSVMRTPIGRGRDAPAPHHPPVLIPLTGDDERWVPMALSIVYVLLSVASWADNRGRRRNT